MKRFLLLAISLSSVLISCATPPPQPSTGSWFFPFENSRIYAIEGVLLHYREWPATGETHGTALLVHGLGGSTYSYRYLAPALAERGFRVIAVDVPGFGYSSRGSRTSFDSDGVITMLWEFMDSIGAAKPSLLVGHSMGGRTVVRMAIERPSPDYRLILSDPSFGASGWSRFLIRIPPGSWFLRWQLETSVLTYDGIQNLLLQAYGRMPTDAEIRGHLDPLLLDGTVQSISAFVRNTGRFREDLDTVEGQTLLLWGRRDTFVPVSEGPPLASQFQNATLEIIEGAAHCPVETHADQALRRIDEFLATRLF